MQKSYSRFHISGYLAIHRLWNNPLRKVSESMMPHEVAHGQNIYKIIQLTETATLRQFQMRAKFITPIHHLEKP